MIWSLIAGFQRLEQGLIPKGENLSHQAVFSVGGTAEGSPGVVS